MYSLSKHGGFAICKVVVAFVVLLLSCSISKAQNRTFSFSNHFSEGLTVENSNRSGIVVRNSIMQLELVAFEDNGYSGDVISAGKGIFLPADAGKPNLPTISRFVAIPNGANVSFRVTHRSVETIQSVDILPAAPAKFDIDNTPDTYEKDNSIYNVDAFYPSSLITISEPLNIRGVEAVAFSITPYQYNPVTKTLKVYYDMEIELVFDGGNGCFGDDRLRSPYWDPILMQNLLNYDQLPMIDYEARMRNWCHSKSTGCEYLIVIPNNESYRPYAQQLADFRIKQGIITQVKSLNEMGCQTTDQMKNYFHNAFYNWDIPPVAVCLLGDHYTSMSAGIPAEYTYHSEDVGYCLTDNGYADVDGDNLPDMVFSRLTATDVWDAETMVSKQIEYEYENPNLEDYSYDKPITALGWQTTRWFQICSEVVGGYWRSNGKHPQRINEIYDGTPGYVWSTAQNTNSVVNYFGYNGYGYIPQFPSSLGGWTGGNAQQIISAINNGTMYLLHRDHGYYQGWGEPDFNVNSVSQLNNVGQLVFVNSINCQTGAFNYSGGCLVERLMKHTYNGYNAGAVGCIAPTEVSFSFVNDTYVWGMFDLYDPMFMPDYGSFASYEGKWMPAFGNVAGKYFLQQSSWPNNISEKAITMKMFTAHCDAFLSLYTQVPQNMTVNHPAQISDETSTITVTALQGSVIAVSNGNQVLAVALATGSPQTLCFDAQEAGSSLTIVATKQDYIRYVGEIIVYENINHTVSAIACPNSTGTVTGGGEYQSGATVTLTANANSGYRFLRWNDGVTTNPRTIQVLQDTIFAAFFVSNSVQESGFSVSDVAKVSFASGNLQFQASTNTWRFAEHPWDIIGGGNSNISSSYDGWIDLFGWGTSGFDHGSISYQPWSTSTAWHTYEAYGDEICFLSDQTGQADWGYNAIINGGNALDKWRTLTSIEWNYVTKQRTTTSGVRFAKAVVNNVNGIIVVPDNWNHSSYVFNSPNQVDATFGSNIISSEVWNSVLSNAGCVFLPVCGYRNGIVVYNLVGEMATGLYWCSDFQRKNYGYNDNIYSFAIDNTDVCIRNYGRYIGGAVRLVNDLGELHTIIGFANPSDGGVIMGSNIYGSGDNCVLVASPASNYSFMNWTENGVIVSTDATYSFTVETDRTLKANFVYSPISYSITATALPVIGGTVNGSGSFNVGEICNLIATANTGYYFVNWTENGEPVSTNPTYSFTVSGNRTLVAHFTAFSYNITTSSNPSIGGSTTGAGSFEYGQTCNITATPTQGYGFINWTENGELVSSETNYSFIVTRNRNLVANFSVDCFEVTAVVNPNGAGTVMGEGNYLYGESCVLEAVANDGYEFVDWTISGVPVSTNCIYSFVVLGNTTLQANFTYRTYQIQTNCEPSDAGIVNGGGSYHYGEMCYLTATPISNYAFINWTENGSVVSTNPNYYFEVENDRNLTAVFSLNSCSIVVLASPSNGGNVYGGGNYLVGQNCTVIATASSGYTFVNWTENGTQVSTNANYSFTVTGNRNLVAHFNQAQSYVITATASPSNGGTVTGSGSYSQGTTCTVTTSSNFGWNFVNWTENGNQVSTQASYSFTVNSNRNLVAHFAQNTHAITATAGANGTINPSGVVNVADGGSQSFEMLPNPNYEVYEVYVDGNYIGSPTSFTFNNVTSDHNIFVTFIHVDGIGENEKGNAVIYPNPTTGIAYLKCEDMRKVTVFDVFGSVVVSKEVAEEGTVTFDLSDWASGVYMVEIVMGESRVVKRIVKM